MTAVIHAIRRALVGTGSTALTLIGACLIGFGIPLFWIWIASHLYDKPGAVNGSVAVFIGTGILVSYWAILLLASWIRARLIGRGLGAGAAPRLLEPEHARQPVSGRVRIGAIRSSASSSPPRSSP